MARFRKPVRAEFAGIRFHHPGMCLSGIISYNPIPPADLRASPAVIFTPSMARRETSWEHRTVWTMFSESSMAPGGLGCGPRLCFCRSRWEFQLGFGVRGGYPVQRRFPVFYANFTSGSGTETTVGPGYEFLLSGTFDNSYFTSANGASPTGHLYVIGGTGSENNTLYQVSINSNIMSTTAATGPAVSENFTNGFSSAGLQATEVFTGSHDYIFLSVLSFGAPAACSGSLTNGCVMGFDVTGGAISAATTPTGATPEAGGTSGIVIDNTSTFGGASNIYYAPLADQLCSTSGGTGGCAIQISQASP